MTHGSTVPTSPNKITGANAGWRTQFRFAVRVFWSRVAETLGRRGFDEG